MRASLICLMSSLFLTFTATAAPFEICGSLKQGEIVSVHFPTAKKLVVNDKQYPLHDGTALVAFRRDETAAVFKVTQADGQTAEYVLKIAPAQWDIQSIKGVAQRKVTPLAEDATEIEREQHDVGAALSTMDITHQSFKKGFITPVDGTISGHFGNQRIFNGTPKNPHSGTDIAAAEGTPIKAASDGTVLLAGGDYFYSGNMVILDHGDGLQTIYAHLKEAKVTPGQTVKQGEIIGLVGKTGRVTGPHLHWGASLNNIRFRPHSLLDLPQLKCRPFPHEQEEK